MMRKPSDSVIGTMAVCLPVLLLIALVFPGAAVAGHKLADSQCVDCHVTGGSLSNVVDQSRLIRIDNRMSEITANVTNWGYGNPLPCIYCHDKADKTVRENMIGVWNDFTNSISSHPVDPYDSNIDGAATGLNCTDCHDNTAVVYVEVGSLSPTIHNQDVSAIGWTPAAGLTAADTFKAWVPSATSPYNAGGNTFCTEQCHDNSTGTGFLAGQAAHGYTSPIVSLENGSKFFTASAIDGCLNNPSTGSGCHAVHNSESTDLITALDWGTTTLVGRDDCGACHVFDDGSASSPLPRSSSDFYTDGHGQFSATCLTCHDSTIPHFQADGTPSVGSSAGRLNFVLDSIPSGFSTPDPNSRLSICVSSNCHSGYAEHAPSTSPSHPVGCLDCHDPHGYGVGSNIMMMRQSAPIATTTVTLSYANSGDWYDSTQPSGFTNFACDSADCHPLSINAIMDTTTGTHGGGTGLKSGCEGCHKHQGGEYSWAATGCDQCHGAGGSYWPSTTGGDDGGTSPDDAGRHGLHRQLLETDLGYSAGTTSDGEQKTMCRYCHKVGDSDHTSSTRAEVFTTGFASSFWDTSGNDNASFVAGTNAGTCDNVDCHNNKSTASPYRWYESGAAQCTMCHTAGDLTNVNPVSGLHDESPSVSGLTHDDSFSYSGSAADCTTCHTSTPSTAHIDGANDSSIGATGNTAIVFTVGVGFADSTIPPSCSVSITGCHLEDDVGETWGRLWHENADQTDGTECAGCHGDFTTGWAAGTMHQTMPTKGNGTHTNTGLLTYECTDCHAIGDATPNYAFTASTNDWNQNAGETSNHGNALITMNDNTTSWARSGGTESGCSNSCHSNGYDATHGFTATGWTPETVTGDVPPVGCDGCHGGSSLFWPQTASVQTTDYPDRRGEHGAHIDALEAKLSYDSTPGVYTTNDLEQRHMCEYCHNDSNGVGGSDHWDYVIPADVGNFNGIWSTVNPPAASDTNGIITGSKTCQDVDCHYDKTTTTETTPNDWYTGGTAGCDYCHTDGTPYAVDDLPDAHNTHADETTAGYGYGCTVCHSGSTSYTDWHAGGSAKSDVSFSGVAITAGFGSPVYGTTAEACDNVYCHGLSGLPDWDAGTGAACGTCHGDSSGKPNTPVTGGSHTSGSHSAAAAADCTRCHENTNTDTTKHAKGPADTEGVALVSSVASSITAYSYGAHLGTDTDGYKYSAGTCATDCHSDGTWGGTGGCTFCHGNGATGLIYPDTASAASTDYPDRVGEHAAHIAALEARIGYSAGTTNEAEQKHLCAYCHSYATEPGEGGHGDNVIPADVGQINPMWDTANPPVTSDGDAAIASSKTCSGVDCHYNRTTPNSWYVDDTADCTLCHNNGTDNGALVNAHPGSGRHTTHVASDDYVPNDCASCHGANANNPPLTDTLHRSGAADFGNSMTSYTAPDCVNACHDVIPASYGDWLDADGLDCLNCHSGTWIAGIYAPSSGLHAITPSVSGVKHAEALSPASRCEVCHTTIAAGQVTHINGTWQADQAANTESRGLFDDYHDGSPGSCYNTGASNEAGTAGCHDGAGELGSWARRWSTTAENIDGTQCANCHGGFDGQAWTFGTVSNTTDGHVEHGRNWDGTGIAEVIGRHADTATQGTTCNICHVYADSPYNSAAWANTWHGNNLIDMNDSMGYSQANWDCSSNCHTGGTPIAMEDSGWTVNPVTGPALSCASCHGASNPSAGVGTNSSHLATVTGGANAPCEACHPGGTQGGMHDKSGDADVIVIRNYSAVGISYGHQPDGTNYGFVLGGDATVGAQTEAEICWGCHDQNGDGLWGSGDVSEWGTNVSTVTGSITYNYGTLNQTNWVGATWSSPNFAYKAGTIQPTTANPSRGSIHTANPSSLGGPGSNVDDTAAQIRCSYCHDVHNTARNRSSVITTTMDPDGEPYLRGNWKGNPYNEDGAPQSGTTYTDYSTYDLVPRASMTSVDQGGYYIDQNTSNDPVERGWTADSMGGLCEYCHGSTPNGTWAATEIDNLNIFGTASNGWVGTNGHANAVLGGTGNTSSNAADIYRESDRKPTDGFLGSGGTDLDGWLSGDDSYGAGMPDMGYSQAIPSSDRGYGFRSANVDNRGWEINPMLGTTRPYGYSDFNTTGVGWGTVLTVGNGTIDNQFHQFSCSKCHNPHASRLPRLMITNCLDTVHNDWDDGYVIPAKGTSNIDGASQIWDDNNAVELAEATSAQNCHRLGHSTNGTGSGWNLVTPW